ncbi:MAG: hypothetical protein L0Y56_13100 [Nitrospira sp.]|nr:hypothetical protein [Nitrospira sp.]
MEKLNSVAVVLLLLGSMMISSQAHAWPTAVELESDSKPGVCLGWKGAGVVGRACAHNDKTKLVWAEVKCDSPLSATCSGRLRFSGTNYCIQADTATTVALAVCNTGTRQKFGVLGWGNPRVHPSPVSRYYAGSRVITLGLKISGTETWKIYLSPYSGSLKQYWSQFLFY